ncbi:MAG: TlpA family protein disulfide reductase [Planctomycetota bacterium]|jgi:hypothetical protein
MRPADDINETIKKLRLKASARLDKRVHDDISKALAESEKTESAVPKPNVWRTVIKNPFAKLAAAAMVIIAVLVAVQQIGDSSLAWASVAERFRSVPFFSATLYMKDNATAQPEQIELWMNRERFARLRYDNQVAFAKEGKITNAFDIKTLSEIEPDQRAVTLVHLMGDAESFSLETVIHGISGGELVDVTPLVNTDAVISEDLVVFDVEHEKFPQWFRIWALRESKLPVRIRMWDPTDGECADILLTYSKEQQEIFFDPEAFSSKAKSLRNTKEMNLAYMFLQDPGGKQIFPGSLNEPEAFQVITQTIDGQPWSLADNRGKVILINFWDRRSNKGLETWLKGIYERFKDRGDFIVIGVSLRADNDSTRKICKDQKIPWLQLHEPGKRLKNSLARAFGIDSTYGGGWLVWKDGTIDRLHTPGEHDTAKVEGALLGLTYSSEIWINQILYKHKTAGTLTIETVEQICGKPHSVNKTDNGERWDYTLFNKDKTAVRKFHIDFDEDGNCIGWNSGHQMLNPAVVTVSFSSQYLKQHIENKVEPEIRGKLFREHLVTISAKSGFKGYPLCWKTSIQAEESYTRKLFPGTYDFVIRIYASSDRTKSIKTITLLKDVKLDKDEKKTIRFE